jgi:hypothetical protein
MVILTLSVLICPPQWTSSLISSGLGTFRFVAVCIVPMATMALSAIVDGHNGTVDSCSFIPMAALALSVVHVDGYISTVDFSMSASYSGGGYDSTATPVVRTDGHLTLSVVDLCSHGWPQWHCPLPVFVGVPMAS